MTGSSPVGKVTHFYNHLGVAIVALTKDVPLHTQITFRGPTTEFSEEVDSMQLEHKNIKLGKAGQQVGIKVCQRVREGDMVYEEVKIW